MKKKSTSTKLVLKRYLYFTLTYALFISSFGLLIKTDPHYSVEATQKEYVYMEPTRIYKEIVEHVEVPVEVEKIVEVEKVVEVPTFIYITDEPTRENILNYMRYVGANPEEMYIWEHIISEESGFNIASEPSYTFVNHCYTNEKGWFAIEIYFDGANYVQDTCARHNATQGMSEKSYGLFQILPSTWKQYQCEGTKENWKDQVNCALTIRNKTGFGAWTTYYTI